MTPRLSLVIPVYNEAGNIIPVLAGVMPGLMLGHSLPDLLATAEGPGLARRLLVFAGYAGWTAGQLDGEMKRESWLTHPATLDLIFSPEPKKLWRNLVSTKGPEYRLLAEAPDDLSWN